MFLWWTGLVTLVLFVLSVVFRGVGIRNATLGALHRGTAITGLVCGVVGALGYLAFGVASAGVGLVF